MMTESGELLSALVDREPVDPDALASILEEPEARTLLVDFVRLRASLLDDEYGTPPETRAATPTAPGRRLGRTWMRVAAASVLVAALASGGLWVRARLADDRPPTPSRVVEFQPGVDWH